MAVEPTKPAAPTFTPLDLRVRMERTVCFGTCPAYSVFIDGSGRVEWQGNQSVAVLGHRTGRVSRHELEELSRRLDRAQFFDRDDRGELAQEPECTTTTTANGSSTSCSFGTSFTICSDTSHTIITVSRAGVMNKIDNDHCRERPELDELENYIDRIARTEVWIKP